MEAGYIVGWVGLAFGVCVPIPQLIKIYRTRSLNDISLWTYIFLVFCLSCYLIHAIYIKSVVFTIAQGFNLITNSTILVLLIRNKG
jgi:uncharacterized protein with PQ loop repeat